MKSRWIATLVVRVSITGLGLALLSGCATGPAGRKTAALGPGGKEWVAEIPNLLPGAKPLILARIPAGSFKMGSLETEAGRDPDESPVHEVILSHDFYLGRYEVTQAQWAALMTENPSSTRGADLPVNRVSWEDCQEYLKRLNQTLQDTRFRLPTEAEREYACRAGTVTATYFGENPSAEDLEKHAWFRENSEGELHPVGLKQPNPWGLYDLYGNVWEWCQDWYGPYPDPSQTNPSGPDAGQEKVFRGASWMAKPQYLRSADRGKFPPDARQNTGGFRVAWGP
ncbi:MAG: formylglycine-generating enzyme family protein [bacterium]